MNVRSVVTKLVSPLLLQCLPTNREKSNPILPMFKFIFIVIALQKATHIYLHLSISRKSISFQPPDAPASNCRTP